MCLGIPGRIVALPGADGAPDDVATVEVSGVRRAVNVALVADEGVAPGDWVLIHVGFALARIDEEEARQTLALLRTMGAAYTDEVAALRASQGTVALDEGRP